MHKVMWCFKHENAAKSIGPRALYQHCYGHIVNLPVADSLKGVKVMSDVILEICKLLKYLPRRDAILHELKEEISAQVPGLHNLCPT